MEENNILNIISNSLVVNKNNIKDNIRKIINDIKTTINNNKEAIIMTNKIDKKNNNGFIIDFNIINNIFNNLEKETMLYGNVILSQKNDNKNIIYGKQIMDIGNVIVINDGNTYVILEMVIRNIMALNTTIFVNNGYMYGSNKFIISLINNILESFNAKYLIQLYLTEDYNTILNNYANIDLVIGIGNKELQSLILSNSKNKTIVCGYDNYDLYIEDNKYIDFINKIIDTKLNIDIYINSNIKIDNIDGIIVSDIDEAISLINYNSSRYSSSIFTNNSENASKFIKEIKSKKVMVNTSPTIERIIDIKQDYLVNEKTIIYPINFKNNN